MDRFSNRMPAWLLSILSDLYASMTDVRNHLYERRILGIHSIPIPVISIGNLAVGGTGKTPFVLWIVQHLASASLKPLIISRGYRGRFGRTPVRVPLEGSHIDYGDEPCMMMHSLKDIPIVVSRDRVRGARWSLDEYRPGCIILDDGFQHRRIARCLDIVMHDCRNPFTRDTQLPSGRLRESIRGLERADIIVFSHCDESSPTDQDLLFINSIKERPAVFRSSHAPLGLRRAHALQRVDSYPPETVAGLVSAIGSPEGFRRSAERFGLQVAYERRFSDHHVISAENWHSAAQEAREAGCTMIVTTAKDEVKIPLGFDICLPIFILDVTLSIENGTELISMILERIEDYGK